MMPGQQSSPLREDDAFRLFRSTARAERDSVLIITPSAERPTPASLARLQRAYQLRHEIDPTWGTRPIALVTHDDGRPALLLEDPGGVVLDVLLGQLEPSDFLRLAVGIAASVSKLHDAGLVHRDIKPSNILVDVASGRAWLTGLCLASRAPKASAPAEGADLSGTLAYMAPEQTGRLNRPVDHRSDLYSLGVTLYQLATGQLPFVASEPLDWIHSHLAKRPLPLAERGGQLPQTVDGIILKLLEKEPEDRYQSAAGLAFDLQKALTAYEQHGTVPWFLLATRDIPEHLLRHSTFHGREAQLASLAAAMESVRQTREPSWLLVRGYSGVGKSSLVHEFLQKRLDTEALVASGKFEELDGEVPYAALRQVIRELSRRILAKNALELGTWRTALESALLPHAALLTELVPELELVLGEQPVLTGLPPDESRNRAFATFGRCLRTFAEKGGPLVIFLDDLQWLDEATIDVVERLMLDPELRDVLLIGAYREQAVHAGHPLLRSLAAVRKAGRRVEELELPALPLSDVTRLVADAVHTSPQAVGTLAQVVEQKTGGNPFFVGQFLATLAEDGLLTFDQQQRSWGWDLEGILARGYTDNLAELVLDRLARLPAETRDALKVLSCLGGSAPSELLAELLRVEPAVAVESLQFAVDARVVTRSRDGYAFPHDRLQETAYSLIPESERAQLHLELGRVLRGRMNRQIPDSVFDVVKHLNRGAHLLEEQTERTELAELNLYLALRSKTAAADASALSYLDAAAQLLPSEAWERLPDLTFQIALARAECEFLIGDRPRARLLLDELARRAPDLARLGAVVCVQVTLHLTNGDTKSAVEVGVAYLRKVGVPWDACDEHDVQRQYARLVEGVRASGVAALSELPRMTSPLVRATMDVCATVVSPAYFVDRNLYALLMLHMATLSMEHGNDDASCLAYSLLSIVLGPMFDNHELGLEFGQLGSRLTETGLTRFAARVYLNFGVIIVPRTTNQHAGLPWIRSCFEAARKAGDLVYAVYARVFAVANMLSSGAPLTEARREAEEGVAYARRNQFPLVTEWIGVQLSLIRTLQGEGNELQSRTRDDGDGSDVLDPTRFYFWVRKLQACYHIGDFTGARAAEEQARRWAWTSAMFPEEVELWLYGALAQAAWATDETIAQALEVMREHEAELAAWASRCHDTFGSKLSLVRAERLRLEGRVLEAEHEFERAARLAREYGFVHEEALAHELAARFYAGRKLASIAQAKWSSARSCYLKWGALGKVARLDRSAEAPGIPVGSFSPSPVAGSLEQLELTAVVSALRAVSSSLELDTLVDGLMRSAVQHAAADRGCLILLAGELRLRADATSEDGTIRVTPLDLPVEAGKLPLSVLRFALRTSEKVLLDEGVIPPPFADDPYLRARPARSLLCMPIVVRGKTVGLLYLENSLSTRAFQPRDLVLLDLLASQAATSLENARLYAGINDAQQRMSQAERVSRTGSFSWKPLTRELSWSEEMLRLYQLDSASFDGMRSRTHPEDLALFDAMMRDAEGFDGNAVEYRLLLPDGSVKYLSVIASRITSQAELTYAGTVRDVTESKRAEEALHRTQAALADMTRVASLGEMAAAIAHEVNQPLAAIGLNASTCLRWLDVKQLNPQEAREAALRITRDANRAGAVVQRLRALFGKSEGLRNAVDLSDAVSEVLTLLRSRIRSSGTTLRLELAADLPSAWGDRVQLQQVIMNLITNALEAMHDDPEGSRELSLRTLLTDDRRLRCEVKDSGPGLTLAAAARLFEPFFSTKQEGMGIGLSIARNILTSHGGELCVRDNGDARGTTFYFELPLAPAEAST
jgi:PAS domain S-box-containing protein